MGLLSTIILGLIAGWATGKLMGKGGYGFFGDVALGIIGAMVGSWLSSMLTGSDLVTGFNLTSIVVAVIGSVVVVAIYRFITRRRILP